MKGISLVLLIYLVLAVSSCSQSPSYPPANVEGTDVVVDREKLRDGEPHFFSLHLDEGNVNFFVVKTKDGIRSYFDACGKCYLKGKGYRVEASGVVCNACDVRYPVDELEGGLASCRPIPLPGKRDGGRYIIKLTDLKAGCSKFP